MRREVKPFPMRAINNSSNSTILKGVGDQWECTSSQLEPAPSSAVTGVLPLLLLPPLHRTVRLPMAVAPAPLRCFRDFLMRLVAVVA